MSDKSTMIEFNAHQHIICVAPLTLPLISLQILQKRSSLLRHAKGNTQHAKEYSQ